MVSLCTARNSRIRRAPRYCRFHCGVPLHGCTGLRTPASGVRCILAPHPRYDGPVIGTGAKTWRRWMSLDLRAGMGAISREASPAARFLPDNNDDDAPATQLDCLERRVGGRPDRGQHGTDGIGGLPVRGDRDAPGAGAGH